MLRTCQALSLAVAVCLLALVAPASASTTSTTFVTTTTSSTTVETTSTSTTVLVTTTSTTEPSTTSTSVSTTTSTSSSSTTTTSTSTTSTTSTSLQVCDCGAIPFMASRVAKLAGGSTVNADLGVNDSFGSVTLAPGATMANGTTLRADRVKLASGSSVSYVHANELLQSAGSTIGGGVITGPLTLPLRTPYCALPILACGTGTLHVDETEAQLDSGNYGSVIIGDGATLVLDDDGPYRFCEVRIANGGTMLFTHQVEVDVTGNVIVGTDSSIRTGGGAPLRLRVGGTKVLLGRNALITAAITAPHAKVKVKKDSVIEGCVCARVVKAAKDATLSCAGDSPSGAFLD
jgi:hypothetical protein